MSDSEVGGQREWYWGVPGVFSALAAPDYGHEVPAAPLESDPHEQSRGYWAALHYILIYRLGWAHPERGLRRWYDDGKPVDDATLALVSEIWDRDGNLDAYLAWVMPGGANFLRGKGIEPGFPGDDLGSIPVLWREWHRRNTLQPNSDTHYLSSSGDPLHLTGHSGESGAPDLNSTLSVISRSGRRAVFITNTMDAWYFDLEAKHGALPDIGGAVWRVDVFVRPVGFLGTFRRSSVTGLWFCGRHRTHISGN